jgi:hypothetical protein
MGAVHSTAVSLQVTRFALAQLILKPRYDWYIEGYTCLCRSFVAGITSLGLENVSKLEAMLRMSQTFVEDQVHLAKKSSKAYINGLLYNADSLFAAEIVNPEEGTSKKPERLVVKVKNGKLEAEFEKSVKSLDRKLVERIFFSKQM